MLGFDVTMGTSAAEEGICEAVPFMVPLVEAGAKEGMGEGMAGMVDVTEGIVEVRAAAVRVASLCLMHLPLSMEK